MLQKYKAGHQKFKVMEQTSEYFFFLSLEKFQTKIVKVLSVFIFMVIDETWITQIENKLKIKVCMPSNLLKKSYFKIY